MPFIGNSPAVLARLKGIQTNWLEETAGELKSQAQRNTRVDTGATKASFQHKVDVGKMEAAVGSNMENAIWEEFGTGIYAENGGGRSDVPWFYKGSDGTWRATKGKRGTRAFRKAYRSVKNKAVARLNSQMRGMNK